MQTTARWIRMEFYKQCQNYSLWFLPCTQALSAKVTRFIKCVHGYGHSAWSGILNNKSFLMAAPKIWTSLLYLKAKGVALGGEHVGWRWLAVRVCRPAAAGIGWQCRSQLGMFHCSPPSPRGAPGPAPPPRWGNDGAGWPPWLKWRLRLHRPPGRSWWQKWRRWASRGTSCAAAAGTESVLKPSSRSRSL